MKKILALPFLIIVLIVLGWWFYTQDGFLDCEQSYDYDYLMSFHSCNEDLYDCSRPQNHQVFLAGSGDGENWDLIEGWESVSGSVPDIFAFEDYLYEVNPNAGGMKPAVREINRCFQVVDEEYNFDISDKDGSKKDYVDPSTIVVNGQMYLFFLLLEELGPADYIGNCELYPCDFSIGIAEAANRYFSEYKVISRVTKTLDLSTVRSMTDPDVIELKDGRFLLAISNGQNVYGFISEDIDGPYESLSTSDWSRLTRAGGVPSLAYIGDELWLYVTTNDNGTEVIKRAKIESFSKEIDPSKFETVLSGSIFGDDNINVSSPNVIDWPEAWK